LSEIKQDNFCRS